MDGARGSPAEPVLGYCYFYGRGAGSIDRSGWTSTTSAAYDIGLSSSDIIDKGSDDDWLLNCYAYRYASGSVDWEVSPYYPVRVTLTRIDKTIGGSLVATRSRPSADVLTPR